MNTQDPQIAALIQALQGQGTYDARNEFRKEQMEQLAQAGKGQQSYGAMAGIGNGLTNAINGYQKGQLAQQQQGAFAGQDARNTANAQAGTGGQIGAMGGQGSGMGGYLQALIQALKGRQQQGQNLDPSSMATPQGYSGDIGGVI